MTKHKFIYKGIDNDRKMFIVKCSKTGGEFSTELWAKLKVQSCRCPCCNEIVEVKRK